MILPMSEDPIRRKVDHFGRRYLLGNLLYFIPAVICFWFLWRSLSQGSYGVGFYIPLIGFLACIAFAIWLDALRLRRFRCPECNARLPLQSKKRGEPLKCHCSKCGILWETDLYQPED